MDCSFSICSASDIEQTTLKLGFLPYFAGKIPGFSIEEHTPADFWFNPECDGPWEWKGVVIRNGKVIYSKMFSGKAVYARPDLYSHLANYRRSLRLLSPEEKEALDTISANESLLSTEIRDLCGFSSRSHGESIYGSSSVPHKRLGLDSVLTRLQMSCHIVVADFEYKIDKYGKPYGWGVARYSTPEILYADSFALPPVSPLDSKDVLLNALDASLGVERSLINLLLG